MTRRPHDVEDLFLAPVALAVDEALAALAGLSQAELGEAVAVRTNSQPRTDEERRAAMLEAVTHLVDLHQWEATWDERGLALTHSSHGLVLGVPRNVLEYVGTGSPLAS